jgi:hypothetical protein
MPMSDSFLGDIGQRPQSLGFAGKGEKVLAAMEKDMTLPHVVAPEHELSLRGVPHREDEIADQMFDAIGAPAPVGFQQQRAVGKLAQLGGVDRQGAGEFFAVVEPCVGDQREPGVTIVNRLGVE